MVGPDPDKARSRRDDYVAFRRMTTRWRDNDAYRHVNNAAYYEFFDSTVNALLIEGGVLDVEHSPVVGLVVETGCRYFASVAFPDDVHVGLRVAHLGRSSVRYEVGLFRNDEAEASASGHFVHVYVDRVEQRPVPIPQDVRDVLVTLQPEAAR